MVDQLELMASGYRSVDNYLARAKDAHVAAQ